MPLPAVQFYGFVGAGPRGHCSRYIVYVPRRQKAQGLPAGAVADFR